MGIDPLTPPNSGLTKSNSLNFPVKLWANSLAWDLLFSLIVYNSQDYAVLRIQEFMKKIDMFIKQYIFLIRTYALEVPNQQL